MPQTECSLINSMLKIRDNRNLILINTLIEQKTMNSSKTLTSLNGKTNIPKIWIKFPNMTCIGGSKLNHNLNYNKNNQGYNNFKDKTPQFRKNNNN
jgi:hypothetical protein